MACPAAVLVEAEQRLHDHDQAGRGQISPNRLCHVCGPLAEMAPDHSRAITTMPTPTVLPVITTLRRRPYPRTAM
jgi:hypothetical protein